MARIGLLADVGRMAEVLTASQAGLTKQPRPGLPLARPRARREHSLKGRDAMRASLEEILELMDRVWPWFRDTHDRAARRGLRWAECSTPFVHREEGKVVAHAGVLELPLVIEGRPVRAAGVHAVATDPAHRGRGHMKRVVEAALAFVDERYELAVLTAGEAELYTRFGFRVVPEHRFVGGKPGIATAASRVARAKTPATPGEDRLPRGGSPPPLRRLDPDRAEECAILRRLLRDRAPVSALLGVTRESPVFLFNTAGHPLHYAPDLDAVLMFDVVDRSLRLKDVVADAIPSLEEVLARVPEPFERVEVWFAPDRLGGNLRAEPWIFGGDEVLMARGPFLRDGIRATLPRTARC